MRPEPQAAPYRPDPQILSLAPWLADAVAPARFPGETLRFRNQRWADAVGLGALDEAGWLGHFARFEALADNLPRPLALRYHGHQFRVYNPEIGDGRGFLFAQLRDGAGRLLDLGTKGSGTTPWSRDGDGRLTLKGAMREVLATEMLEALGVNTSKSLSVIETGESLWRSDEPSPTRSAVLVRLSHGHIRIGSFQRLYALGQRDELAALTDYCLRIFPGPLPPADAPGRDQPAVILLHQTIERLADQAASYMAAGFVHGVLNTDNMNITGESFDYGPWRWLPRWDGGFTAAYFDHAGLYAFGRQPEAFRWNCAQLAQALSPLAEVPALIAALDRFEGRFQQHLARRVLWRLGRGSRGAEADAALLEALGAQMRESAEPPDALFFALRGWRHNPGGELGARIAAAPPATDDDDPLWSEPAPPTLLIEEVERVWTMIDEADDWSAFTAKVAAIRRLGNALGPAPAAAGHLPDAA
ncbi:MAG: YdiU family protein [Sphingomonadales bacterium]|nr:YdiU family protein [Sphingomonadales bacterium]